MKMNETEWLAGHFEQERPRLRAMAYRMLGSVAEAEDAVQDAWLRLGGSAPGKIDNLAGWLTTVVGRECLHILRTRRRRQEEARAPAAAAPLDGVVDPEEEALLADSVGLALLVVLNRLGPAERLAFVLHDMFELPFDEIAGIVGRSPAAVRQLASRARRRVNGASLPSPEQDMARQRQVVDAFYAASRAGDFDALVQILAPDVVLMTNFGAEEERVVVHGVGAVLRRVRGVQGGTLHPVYVNGEIGALITRYNQPFATLVFTVIGDRIIAIDGSRNMEQVVDFAMAAGISSPPVTSSASQGS